MNNKETSKTDLEHGRVKHGTIFVALEILRIKDHVHYQLGNCLHLKGCEKFIGTAPSDVAVCEPRRLKINLSPATLQNTRYARAVNSMAWPYLKVGITT